MPLGPKSYTTHSQDRVSLNFGLVEGDSQETKDRDLWGWSRSEKVKKVFRSQAVCDPWVA